MRSVLAKMSEAEAKIEHQSVLDIIPIRYPFVMIDKIVERSTEHSICIKNVSHSEEVFVGHFPGLPILPGTLITEGMAQTCGVLMQYIEQTEFAQGLLVGLDKVRFRRQVIPGDQLVFHARLQKARGGLYKFEADAKIDGELVAEADITLMKAPEEMT